MNNKGIVYIMSTIVPGLIKIGITQNKRTFKHRMYQLERNGYRNITGLKREFAIKTNNYKEIEKIMQKKYKENRVGNTELFAMNIETAKQILLSISKTVVYDKRGF